MLFLAHIKFNTEVLKTCFKGLEAQHTWSWPKFVNEVNDEEADEEEDDKIEEGPDVSFM